MASGFIILTDGRCFAPRWSVYDKVIEAIVNVLSDTSKEKELKTWLISILPGKNDITDIGYGPWVRTKDNQTIERYLDLREMNFEYQNMFQEAIKRAASDSKNRYADKNESITNSLNKLADMVYRIERGEEPLSLSDWDKVVPTKGDHIGPK
jgi:hypothetical protein